MGTMHLDPDACLAPTQFVDSAHPAVVAFAQRTVAEAGARTDRQRASVIQPLLAPSVSPPMKCFCSAMNTAMVGMAIIVDAAAIRL